MPPNRTFLACLALCVACGCLVQIPNGVFECDTADECPGGFSCWSDRRCYDSDEPPAPPAPPEPTDFDGECGQVVTRNGVTVTLQNDLACDEPVAIKVEASDVVVDLNGYTISSNGEGAQGILVQGSDVVVVGVPSPGSTADIEGRAHSAIEGFGTGVLFRKTIEGSISDVWVSDCEAGFSLTGGTRNITLSDIGATAPTFAGVVVRNDSEQNQVLRFEQDGGYVGVNVEKSDDTLVEQCQITGVEQHGIMVGLLPTDGIDLPSRTIVRDNVVMSAGVHGIVARANADITVSNNRVFDAGQWGIKAEGAVFDEAPLANEVEGSGELDQCLPLTLCE
ncbi:MAG: right-handed parallel beta-helix repeat-containing protein [Myxococcota bacterium]